MTWKQDLLKECHRGIHFANAMSLKVIAIDSGSDKETSCLKSGADHFLDYANATNLVEKVISITEGGANAVIAAAASKASYIQVRDSDSLAFGHLTDYI